MKTLNLGSTGVPVSVLALGCLPFGTTVSESLSFQLLDRYVDRGGNFLDTSDNYAFWVPGARGDESERLLGRWFAQTGNRHRVVLATKLGAAPRVPRDEFFAYAGDPWADLTEGLSAAAIEKAVNESLRRLNTDRIDLLYAHVDDRRTDQDETLEAFDRLKRSGKVGAFGASNFAVWRLARAQERAAVRGLPRFDAFQVFHTYLQTEKGAATGMFAPLGPELVDYAKTMGPVTLLGYTPLLWGSYTQPEKYQREERLKRYLRPQNEVRLLRLAQVAQETGWTVNQVIYAWMLASDPPVIPLVAVSSLAQLDENLAAADLVLSREHRELLDEPLD